MKITNRIVQIKKVQFILSLVVFTCVIIIGLGSIVTGGFDGLVIWSMWALIIMGLVILRWTLKTNVLIYNTLFRGCDPITFEKIYLKLSHSILFIFSRKSFKVNILMGLFFQGKIEEAFNYSRTINEKNLSFDNKTIYYFFLVNYYSEKKNSSAINEIIIKLRNMDVTKKKLRLKEGLLNFSNFHYEYLEYGFINLELINNGRIELVKVILNYYKMQNDIEHNNLIEAKQSKKFILENGFKLFYARKILLDPELKKL